MLGRSRRGLQGPDKNGKRYHPYNPFQYVIQILKRHRKSVLEGMREAGVSEVGGEKIFQKTKKKADVAECPFQRTLRSPIRPGQRLQ